MEGNVLQLVPKAAEAPASIAAQLRELADNIDALPHPIHSAAIVVQPIGHPLQVFVLTVDKQEVPHPLAHGMLLLQRGVDAVVHAPFLL